MVQWASRQTLRQGMSSELIDGYCFERRQLGRTPEQRMNSASDFASDIA
jgi:hypothetical protein